MINARKIHTIGHSSRTQNEFLEVLKSYGIELLFDVRSFPRSKRHPWFNRENLVELLEHNGIGYQWMKGLGGFRKTGYETYTASNEFRRALSSLTHIAVKRSSAIMCSEIEWRSCHRRFIASQLTNMGWKVIHIYDIDSSEPHQQIQYSLL